MPTSDPQRCYVYLQLPDTLDVVTCGLFEHARDVGRFVYGNHFLADPRAVELDRIELPLRTGTFETARLGGIFGALRDASPDAWGRRIVERQLGRTDLSEIDYLLHSPEDRAGALSFGPTPIAPTPPVRFNRVVHLRALLQLAELVERDVPIGGDDLRITDLIQPGSSLGGARPKNVVEDDEGLWVAKFPSRSDRWNNAAVEGGMLKLAAACGLSVPAFRRVRVGKKDVLFVQRFDRKKVDGGYLRHRMVSALTVLRADEQRTNWSYVLLADELRRWVTNPVEDVHELFGRMVFNALISNIDDHPRNHALIAEGASWRLSPAYDLTPSPAPSTERDLAMEVCLSSRRATRANLIRDCGHFRLTKQEALARINRTKKIVSERWRRCVRDCGGTKADLDQIARAFDFEGFEYSAD